MPIPPSTLHPDGLKHARRHRVEGDDDLESLLRLAQFAEKAHASLTGVTSDQHHARSHDHSLAADGSPIAVAGVPNLPASKITSGQFPLARMPRDAAGKYIRAYGTDFDPMYSSIPEGDLPHLYASLLTLNGGLTMGGDLNMNANAITTVNGIIFWGGSLNMNNHAIQNVTSLAADSISVNTLSVATTVNCTNWIHADITFENKFRITEAEKLGLGKGLAFLNPKDKLIMLLDEDGNIEISGKLKENSKKS